MDDLRQRAPDLWRGYSEESRPLGGYLALMGAFASLFLGFVLLTQGRWKKLPERFRTSDLLLLGVATHDLGRILSKAGITSPLRAPFTEFEGQSGPPAEVSESARGSGLRHALGELVTCPFCLSLWVAALFSYGLVLSPRVTRLLAAIFTIDAISDNLNLFYDAFANITTKAPDVLTSRANSHPASE